MNIMDLCKAYAEVNPFPIHPITVKEQYDSGLITKYELFDAYLRNEGIHWHTNQIISAFRICYEID